jgi:CHAT domain-containing protein/Tfp pilus assembly protein PilF
MIQSMLRLALWTLAVVAPGRPLALEFLRVGQSVEHRLSVRGQHTYRIAVSAGDFIRVAADQHDVDLTLTIRDGRAQTITTSDLFDSGEESLSWIAERSDTWLLSVHATRTGATRGSYRLRLAERRPATEQDRVRIAAESMSCRVRALRRAGTKESLREAIDTGVRAAKLWHALKHHVFEGRANIELGDIRVALNEYDAARRYYELALPLSRSAGDRRAEAEILNNLAMTYREQGDTQRATGLLSDANEVWKTVGDSNGRGATLNNLGLLSWQTGQTRDALHFYEEALTLLRRARHVRGAAYVQNNIALIYASVGDYDKALAAFRQAIAMFVAVGDSLAAGRAWSARAKIELLRNDVPAAKRSIARALRLIEPTGDRRGLAEALNNLCQVKTASGESAAALDAGTRARALFIEIGDRRGEGLALHNTGLLRLQSSDSATGIAELEQALDRYRAAAARENEAAILYQLAICKRDSGELRGARTLLESSLDVLESLRAQAPGERFRAAFLASRIDYYSVYIDLLMRMYEARPDARLYAAAFQAAERARARVLVDVLRERQWEVVRDADPGLIRRGDQIHRQLTYLLEKIGRDATADQSVARRDIEKLLDEMQTVRDRIRVSSPRAALLFSPAIADVRTVQQELVDEETVLLEFSLGDPASYVFAVTSTAAEVRKLPSRARIERLARAVSEQFHRSEDPRRTLARLAQVLLGPLKEDLRKRRLLIAADGALHYVPFAALPHPGSGRVLLEDHEIISVPSATALIALGESRARRSVERGLAVIADPVYDSADSRIPADRRRSRAMRDSFARLVFSGRSAAAIAALAAPEKTLMLTGFDADKQKLTQTHLDAYQIVHFAVHGIVDELRPDLSGLVLSLAGRDGLPRDGYLRLIDVYNLQLRADLVVLSACRTSIGPEVRGEGLMALTRGFLHAGASALIASLWPVDDESASELMQQFYRRIFGPRRLRPAAALREAQLAIRADSRWASPYHWASHCLQGMEVPVQ